MLTELLGTIPLGDLGLSGVVLLIVVAILTGKLVPKSTLDQANANSAKWQDAYMTQQEINAVNSRTAADLLAGQRASLHALQEIQAAGAYALSQRRSEEQQ